MSTDLMRVLTSSGVEVVEVETESPEASTVGQHWNAVKDFLHQGEVSVLAPFESVQIAGYRLATDPDWIERWAMAGELDFEDIYEGAS